MKSNFVDINHGELPQLSNLSIQMALLNVASEINPKTPIDNNESTENLIENSNVSSFGLKAICEAVLSTPIEISVAEEIINSSIDTISIGRREKQVLQSIVSKEPISCSNIPSMEKTNFLETLKEECLEKYQNAVLSLALRLCEPVQVHNILQIATTESVLEQTEKAVNIIKKQLEKYEISFEEVPKLFCPHDFDSENRERQNATLNEELNQMAVVDVQDDIELCESKSNLSKIVKAAKKLEGALRYSSSNISDVELNDEVYLIEDIQEPILQAGFIKISKSFFPTAVLNEIIPLDIIKSEQFESQCGTFLMKKIIRNTALTVEDIIKYVKLEDFSTENLNDTSKLISKIQSNVTFSTVGVEVVQSENFEPFMKGVNIVKNLVAQENHGTALHEVVNYLELAKFKNFSTPNVQMAFIRLAKRISNPLDVEEVLIQELEENEKEDQFLGFKVFANIMLKNPYSITNVESFIVSEDLLETTSKRERACIERIQSEMNSPVISEEAVINQRYELHQKRFAQISQYIQEIMDHRNENINVSEGLISKFSNVDDIQSQAALLGFASQLSSVATVHKTLALEMVKSENVLPFIGSLAVMNLPENIAVESNDVDTYFKELSINAKKQKESFATWENIASFLQYGSIPTECIVVNEFKRPLQEIAMRKVVNQLQKTSDVKLNQPFQSLESIEDSMKNLSAQIAMTTVSEQIMNAPIMENILKYELSSNDTTCLPFIGFKALKTAVESLPVNVTCDALDSLLVVQDIEQERIESKMAFLLDTAYSMRTQVSFSFILSSVWFLYV